MILPLSLSGTLVGASFTFVLALGDFVTPQMVGGMNGLTFGRIIYSQFGFAFNWPFGSALSIILLVFVAIVLAVDRPRFQPQERDRMRLSRLAMALLATIAVFVVLLLYGPLAVAIFFSFFRLERNAVQWDSFSFDAYGTLFRNEAILDALKNTLLVGLTAVALAIGLRHADRVPLSRQPIANAAPSPVRRVPAVPHAANHHWTVAADLLP